MSHSLLLQRRFGAWFPTQLFAKGVAELMVTAEVIVVGDIPLLGSGKVEFARLKRLVEERLPVSSPA
jgi:hypothetical protein